VVGGPKVANTYIVATNGFNKVSKMGGNFCLHVGVSPFSFHSGTSQRSRNKVSTRPNKELKTLYHMAALSRNKNGRGKFP